MGNEHPCQCAHAIDGLGARLRRHWRRGIAPNVYDVTHDFFPIKKGDGMCCHNLMVCIFLNLHPPCLFDLLFLLYLGSQAFGTARVYSVEGNVFFGSARHFEVLNHNMVTNCIRTSPSHASAFSGHLFCSNHRLLLLHCGVFTSASRLCIPIDMCSPPGPLVPLYL